MIHEQLDKMANELVQLVRDNTVRRLVSQIPVKKIISGIEMKDSTEVVPMNEDETQTTV